MGTEINCQPVENEEYHRISNQRALLALRPRQKTQLLDNKVTTNNLQPGTIGTAGNFANLVVSLRILVVKQMLIEAAQGWTCETQSASA